MKKILKKLVELISEDNGNLSSMRIIVFLIVITVLGNWTWYNISHGTLVGFDWEELSAIGIPLLFKAVQKKIEQNVQKTE